MKNRKIVQMSLVTASAFVVACLLLPNDAPAQTRNEATQNANQTAQELSPTAQNANQAAQGLSQTVQAGHYTITLKVLPVVTFEGPTPDVIRDGGAQANKLDGPNPPNNHLAAFITEDGKPVEFADVEISYRTVSHDDNGWITLPVVRMHAAGKGLGLETTRFGNNVSLNLPTDSYEVRVTVNGTGPVTFHFPH